MRHFSMYPLMWSAACGVEGELLFWELALVDCEACRQVVARAEIQGTLLGRSA